MIASHSHCRVHRRTGASKRSGFSLTELLVVIGIIVLLIGLLLVALGQVRKRALRSRTESVMTQFANACTTFQGEHGVYPGVVPDDVINSAPAGLLTHTENALLHLSGGYRVVSPNEYGTAVETEYDAFKAAAAAASADIEMIFGSGNAWKIIVDRRKIGEGPVINGKPYGPYFTPGPSDIAPVQYAATNNEIPDLIDGWGQPIIYIRAVRSRGPLVDRNPAANPRPQFLPWGTTVDGGVWPYLRSTALGDLGANQDELSTFGVSDTVSAHLTDPQVDDVFALVLAHPAFYKSTSPRLGSPRGQFMLWSAGADGVFMSRIDGTGSAADPIGSGNVVEKLITPGPRALDEFDDVRIYGGG